MKKFRKALAILLTLSLCVTLLSACSKKEDEAKAVNILTYAGYIPDTVLEKLKADGFTVNYTSADSNEQMYDKLKSSPELYDIVLCSDYMLDTMIKAEMLKTLDTAKIENFKNINPEFQGKYYDLDNKYTVPYAPGSPLIIYNPDKVDKAITSYADLWDPSFADSLVLIDDMRVVTGITLKSLGYSMNETNEAKLDAAKNKLISLSPNVKLFDSNEPHNALISGDASVGFIFNSQAVAALNANPNLKVVYPAEGLGFGIDCFAISAKAPHADNALEFLNFMLDGKIGAEASEGIFYTCCNSAADEYLSAEFKSNPAIYFPEGKLSNAEFIMPLEDSVTSVYVANWTAFKNS